MDDPTAKGFPPKEVTTIKVEDPCIVVTCGREFRGKSEGYWKETTSIRKIVDKHGKTHQGVWEKQWTRIAPGIETCCPNTAEKWGRQEAAADEGIRIQRSACPVWILFGKTSELIYYDEEGESSSYEYWHRYDAA